MLEQKNNNVATTCFIASLVSVAASIAVWVAVDGDPAHAERFGIFVGLWAPTLMGLANYFREQTMTSNLYEFLSVAALVICATGFVGALRYAIVAFGRSNNYKKL